MGINPLDFRQYVIRPTLKKLGTWSPSLENLLLGTASTASDLGISLGCNKGLGVYKISTEVHHNVWDEYFAFDPDLASKVRGMASQRDFLAHPDLELTTNLIYATAIAWGVYAQKQADIPENEENHQALAECWSLFFNTDTSLTKQHFIDSYKKVSKQADSVIAA